MWAMGRASESCVSRLRAVLRFPVVPALVAPMATRVDSELPVPSDPIAAARDLTECKT